MIPAMLVLDIIPEFRLDIIVLDTIPFSRYPPTPTKRWDEDLKYQNRIRSKTSKELHVKVTQE